MRDSVVYVLFDREVDINLRMKDGLSVFYYVCEEGNDSIIKILLFYGVEVYLCKNDGLSFFYIVFKCGCYKIV